MQKVQDKEQAALAAVKQADADEAYRGFCWGLLSVEYKRRALSLARIEGNRAGEPLASFTPEERGRIAVAASACATQMELIAQVAGQFSGIRAPKVDAPTKAPKAARGNWAAGKMH